MDIERRQDLARTLRTVAAIERIAQLKLLKGSSNSLNWPESSNKVFLEFGYRDFRLWALEDLVNIADNIDVEFSNN